VKVTLKTANSGFISFNCVDFPCFHYQKVYGRGYEFGEFGVEQEDKEQNQVSGEQLEF